MMTDDAKATELPREGSGQVVVPTPPPPWGVFDPAWPKVELIDVPGRGTRCLLMKPFRYTDKNGVVWEVAEGFVSDGASIPRALWTFFGHPFEDKNLMAALPHDFFCSARPPMIPIAHGGHRSGSVHRMFYEALRCAGRGSNSALVMYSAVRRFGPHW
jgi:hypothetical protein